MLRVLIAQVVAVGFGERGKRAENGSLIGVRVGECCRRLACTGGTRAAPGGIHRVTLPPPGRGGRQLEPPTSRVVTKGQSRALRYSVGVHRDLATQAHSPVQVRSERRRDRRGRGLRGPMALPAPLDTAGARLRVSRSQRFDELALGIVDRLKRRWPSELSNVQFGVEETPPITHDWTHDPIPLAALVQPLDGKPARIVLYRRPMELRARGRSELTALLYEVVVERVADLLDKDPEDVDPRP